VFSFVRVKSQRYPNGLQYNVVKKTVEQLLNRLLAASREFSRRTTSKGSWGKQKSAGKTLGRENQKIYLPASEEKKDAKTKIVSKYDEKNERHTQAVNCHTRC
jgi:hypothetical protein